VGSHSAGRNQSGEEAAPEAPGHKQDGGEELERSGQVSSERLDECQRQACLVADIGFDDGEDRYVAGELLNPHKDKERGKNEGRRCDKHRAHERKNPFVDC